MLINILVDNSKSWFLPYAEKLFTILRKKHQVFLIFKQDDIKPGDIALFLACERLVRKEILQLNTHNLVVHESALPQGKGWSPLTWQILEGKDNIPVTLFEAEESVDNGVIYFQENITFDGHELVDELRAKQGEKTIELIKKFVDSYPNIVGIPQKGDPSFYRRRKSSDSELDVKKSLEEQFNLLRVVDNDRYPAFFRFKGQTYLINIYKKYE